MEGCDSMKIEKVNDHQIRCTLTKSDLADRELKISELAYGTDKAKGLFRDMMQQAAYEFGFEAEDIPLMIEAIPLSSDCIVLIITKVEDPEELDTRFSKFAPSVHEEENIIDEVMQSIGEDTDNVLDLFKKISQEKGHEDQESATEDKEIIPEAITDFYLAKAYSFNNIDSVVRLSHVLNQNYQGRNSLFKNNRNERLFLVISKSDHSLEEFNKVCNVISEYGLPERYTQAGEAFFEEHTELIIKDNALQVLTQM